jgi:hypothetical protein
MGALSFFLCFLQTDKPSKDSKNKFPKPGRLVLGPVVLTWDSSSIAVCGGEGIVGGVKYQFADTLSGVPETTLSVGVGGSVGGPALNASAAATVNVTFAGECELFDYSFDSIASVATGNMPVDIGTSETVGVAAAPLPGINEAVSATATQSLRSGPSLGVAGVGMLGAGTFSM